MIAKCAATKPNGERCERIVGPSQTYCHAHDPRHAERRRRAAAKAGRSTPNPEIKEVKGLLKKLTEGVLAGELQTSPAAVANQLINTRLRAIELERRWREVEDLEGRLEALEAELKLRRSG